MIFSLLFIEQTFCASHCVILQDATSVRPILGPPGAYSLVHYILITLKWAKQYRSFITFINHTLIYSMKIY